eukprot:3808079-Amphidinium_carterae.1
MDLKYGNYSHKYSSVLANLMIVLGSSTMSTCSRGRELKDEELMALTERYLAARHSDSSSA